MEEAVVAPITICRDGLWVCAVLLLTAAAIDFCITSYYYSFFYFKLFFLIFSIAISCKSTKVFCISISFSRHFYSFYLRIMHPFSPTPNYWSMLPALIWRHLPSPWMRDDVTTVNEYKPSTPIPNARESMEDFHIINLSKFESANNNISSFGYVGYNSI